MFAARTVARRFELSRAVTARLTLCFWLLQVDAGADCVITQLFYDIDLYLKWVQDCRDIGIKVPIIPGIMPLSTYAGFNRMTGF